MSQPVASPEGQISQILEKLQHNLQSKTLSETHLKQYLLQLKLFGRDSRIAGLLYTKAAIQTLARYGLEGQSNDGSREALRCLANAFLLSEPTRQIFVDLGFASTAADRLKAESHDDEFLLCRILFYLTYNTTLDFDVLIEKNGLADTLAGKVLRHSKYYDESAQEIPDIAPEVDLALAETLKLIFNITVKYQHDVKLFDTLIEPLVRILLHHRLAERPLQSPIIHVMNVLMDLDLGWVEDKSGPSPLFPESNPSAVIDRLSGMLESAIRSTPEPDLELSAASLVTLLRRTYQIAEPQMKARMRTVLLPSNSDRDQPLGKGDTFSARLLRLTTSPHLPTLRDNVAGLLFELNDEDPTKLIRSIGYGYASGFLVRQGLNVGSALTANEQSSDGDIQINPITGQRLNAEQSGTNGDDPDWTPEEKEREAERLFVLFERLKATGIVDVKNPVERRFEEVDD